MLLQAFLHAFQCIDFVDVHKQTVPCRVPESSAKGDGRERKTNIERPTSNIERRRRTGAPIAVLAGRRGTGARISAFAGAKGELGVRIMDVRMMGEGTGARILSCPGVASSRVSFFHPWFFSPTLYPLLTPHSRAGSAIRGFPSSIRGSFLLTLALPATESTTRSQARWRALRSHGGFGYGRECREPRNSPRNAASPSGNCCRSAAPPSENP